MVVVGNLRLPTASLGMQIRYRAYLKTTPWVGLVALFVTSYKMAANEKAEGKENENIVQIKLSINSKEYILLMKDNQVTHFMNKSI